MFSNVPPAPGYICYIKKGKFSWIELITHSLFIAPVVGFMFCIVLWLFLGNLHFTSGNFSKVGVTSSLSFFLHFPKHLLFVVAVFFKKIITILLFLWGLRTLCLLGRCSTTLAMPPILLEVWSCFLPRLAWTAALQFYVSHYLSDTWSCNSMPNHWLRWGLKNFCFALAGLERWSPRPHLSLPSS
jgi:hypothetical protein